MDPGTILAVTSLTFQVFAGCVSGFNIVCDAQAQGESAHLMQTMLDFEEYRFILWSRRVGLLGQDPPRLDQRMNGVIASELMKQLRHLLSDQTLSSRYSLSVHGPAVAGVAAPGSVKDPSQARSILDAVVSDAEKQDVLFRAKLIQNKTAWPKRVWWSIRDKKKFEALVSDVRSIIDALWALLSDVQQNEGQQVMSQMLATVVQLSKDVSDLRALQTTINTSQASMTGTAMVGTAAGLRATRLQLGDTDHPAVQTPIYAAFTMNSLQQQLPASSLDIKAHLVTECAKMDRENLSSMGRYDGQAVYLEFKPVDVKLKGPLRKRVQDIVTILADQKPPGFHALHAKGFFEDSGGFKIVYHVPAQDPSATLRPPHTLLELLNSDMRPSLNTRIRLATRICRTVLTLHVAGWLHKGLRSEHILFFPDQPKLSVSVLENPQLAGFNFSRLAAPTEFSESISADIPARDIYRDPDCFGEPIRFERYMDLYALGTILIEICEWWPLKKIIRTVCDIDKGSSVWTQEGEKVRPWLQRRFIQKHTAAFRGGESFARLIQLCFDCKDKAHQQSETEAISEFHEALIALEATVL